MLKISDVADQLLTWSRASGWKRTFTLAAGDLPAGRLEFQSAFGTLAKAETAGGCWTFKRVGFWQQRATIRACGAETDLASFQNQTWSGGGTLECAGGQRFRATTNFWQNRLQFETETGDVVVRFAYGGVFSLKAHVEVAPDARTLHELPLLVCFGWYLAVMLHDDAAASAVVITS